MTTLSGMAFCHLQADYAGMERLLQQEWKFLQYVTSHMVPDLYPVVKALQKAFLPDLLHGIDPDIPVWEIIGLLFNLVGMYLLDTPAFSLENWTSSISVTGHLVDALRGTTEFRSADHDLMVGKVQKDIHQINVDNAELFFWQPLESLQFPGEKTVYMAQDRGTVDITNVNRECNRSHFSGVEGCPVFVLLVRAIQPPIWTQQV